ncbi:hypothetical protein LWI28_009038 [Acer negundo]|uniref:MADS-box domain-containing protein n=1 Tax=Acer negundo TaxID=4023 RepID=A0AAD5NYU0_ACENE|nr:hypothetical protein LWI28_009038 [Acer negundo]
MAESGKKTRGKKVIELKRIEDDKNRVITFSKRKSGIYKKASDLATLTGAKVGVVMFSPSGKPYSFGDPSIEDVTNLFQGVSQPLDGSTHHAIEAYRKMKISKLLQDHNDVLHQLDDEKEHGKKLEEMTKGKTSQGWWESSTDDLNVQQLRQLLAAFEKLSKTTHSKINQRNLGGGGASSSSFPAVNTPQTRI